MGHPAGNHTMKPATAGRLMGTPESAFGRAELVLDSCLPSAEALGFLLSSRKAGLAPEGRTWGARLGLTPAPKSAVPAGTRGRHGRFPTVETVGFDGAAVRACVSLEPTLSAKSADKGGAPGVGSVSPTSTVSNVLGRSVRSVLGLDKRGGNCRPPALVNCCNIAQLWAFRLLKRLFLRF
jgi:hypothetical protein